jgi:hypothetical protein
MSRLLLVLVVLAVIALCLWGMSRSWRRRIDSGAGIPALVSAPTVISHDAVTIDHATYLGTVTTQHWLDRVAAQRLGHRGPASVVVVPEGLVVERVGTESLFIPEQAISGVELGRGLAGRVYGKDGVIIVTWTWGDVLLQTGIRIPDEHGRTKVVSALAQLPSGQQWSGSDRSQTPIGEG